MKFKSVLVCSLLVAFSFSQVMNAQSQKKAEPWPVPDKEKNTVNPVKADDATMKLGTSSWSKNCASCHGKTGLGDGVKGRMGKTFPGDFSSATFQGSTDGELFYRTRAGRGEMPSFANKVPDNEIWAVVNYMRTFKK